MNNEKAVSGIGDGFSSSYECFSLCLLPSSFFSSADCFAEEHRAGLTVMPGGEHWFHTPEQMQFLDDWMKKLL